MKFQTLKLNNFLSFKKAEFDFSKPGIFLVEGRVSGSSAFASNGAGKTNLFEGVSWTLFGETLKGVDNSRITYRGQGNCRCSLDILLDDNTRYRVTRYRDHEKYGNKLLLQIYTSTGELSDLSCPDMRDTQKEICKILGMNFKSFANSVFFGQGTISRIANSSDSDLKEILEDILDLKDLPKAYELARKKLFNLELECSRWGQVVEKNTQTINRNLEVIKEANTSMKSWIRKAVMVAKSRLKNIIDLEHRLSQLEDKIIAGVGLAKEQIEANNKKVASIKKKISKFNDRFNNEAVGEKESLVKEISQIKLEISKINDQYRTAGEECSSCGGIITVRQSDALREKIQKSIMSMSSKLKKLNSRLIVVDRACIRNVDICNRICELNRTLATLEMDNRDMNSGIKAGMQLCDSIIPIYLTYLETERTDQKVGEHISGLKDMATKLTKENRELQEEIQSAKNDLAKAKKTIKYLQFWVEGFSNKGIKSLVIDSVTPFINKKIEEFSTIICDGLITAEFDTHKILRSGESRRKMSINTTAVDGGESYDGISGGEKRRIDICIALAFRELVADRGIKSVPILVLDEAFDSLDSIGIERTAELIQGLNQNNQTIFVITHKPELRDYFGNVITIEKKQKVSRIV